jgi:hypothetical protein
MSRLAFRSLRAFVAILALALSALGSPRSAWERCDFWDNDDAQAAVAAHDADPSLAAIDRLVTGWLRAGLVRPTLHPRSPRALTAFASADIPCPGPRRGSALGARAPDSAT